MNPAKLRGGANAYFTTRYRLVPITVMKAPEMDPSGEWRVEVLTKSKHPTGWPYDSQTYIVNCALLSKSIGEAEKIGDLLKSGKIMHPFIGDGAECQICGNIKEHLGHIPIVEEKVVGKVAKKVVKKVMETVVKVAKKVAKKVVKKKETSHDKKKRADADPASKRRNSVKPGTPNKRLHRPVRVSRLTERKK